MSKLNLEIVEHLSRAKGIMYLADNDQTSDYEARKKLQESTAKQFGQVFPVARFTPEEFAITSAPGVENITIYTALWRPPIGGFTDVELHGGPCDGTVIPDGYSHGAHFVAKYEKPVGEAEFEVDPNVENVHYSLDGWNPESKNWIYQAEL